MKINFIVPGIFKTGGMRVICELCNRLHDRGHEVKFYYPLFPFDSYLGEISYRRFRTYLGNFKNSLFSKRELGNYHIDSSELKNFFTYRFEIQRVPFITDKYIEDADAVLATTWPTAYSVNNLSPAKGIKFYFIQGYEIWNSNVTLAENSYRLGIKGITVSEYLKNLLKEKFAFEPKVIGNGINFSEFYVTKEKDYNSDLVVSYIDSPYKLKNTEILLEILFKVKERVPNLKVICFGVKKDKKFPDFFEFVQNPSSDKIREIYNKSHIFLYSSLQEGYGLPPAEAMACKTIPISTSVGAIPEYIMTGYSGYLLEPEEIFKMVEIICDLNEDRKKMKNISENAFNSVREFFDWERVVSVLEDYLKSFKY